MIGAMTKPAPSAPSVRTVVVDAGQDGQRIDNYLVRVMKGVPRSHVYRLLRTGQVRVNKGRIRADYRLREGDQVRIPPVRQAQAADIPRLPEGLARQLQQAVLYEDADLLVLNKPAGLAVHAGSNVDFGVIEALRRLRPGAAYLELVHRLDRDTSGCLILAKNRPALLDLQAQMRDGGIVKGYLTLVAGRWPGGGRTVSAPLAKNALRGGERMVEVTPEGKPAVSRFEPLERFRDATLMEVYLETGRTHQIRVHAAHSGHPVAGDPKYGSAEFNRRMKRTGLKRMFLHAHRVAFRRPGANEDLDLSAPLDSDLRGVLDQLERQE